MVSSKMLRMVLWLQVGSSNEGQYRKRKVYMIHQPCFPGNNLKIIMQEVQRRPPEVRNPFGLRV